LNKIRFFFSVLVGTLLLAQSLSFAVTLPELRALANIEKTQVCQSSLPAPYAYLLTQPLMTKGIENYYQCRATIQTLYAQKSKTDNTYFRVILMLLDKNKARTKLELAQRKKDTRVAELAFITMNFNELPKKVIEDVLHTTIPFGKSLLNHQVKTRSENRSYFFVNCNKMLSSLTHCRLKHRLYGRSHTLIRADNQHWVARVVEILPAEIPRR
jgi:hypothetical protein